MDSNKRLGVQHGHHIHNGTIAKPPPAHHHHHARRKQGRQNGGGKGIKVVYISSPMKLTASAEEFRAVVQELTGRDSNVADHDLDLDAACYSYSSFQRVVSPTATATATAAAAAAAGPRALSPTTTTNAGPVRRRTPEYDGAAVAEPPPPFQGVYYEYDDDHQTAESLLYGQDYW